MTKGIGKVKRLDNIPEESYQPLYKTHKKSLITAGIILIVGIVGTLLSSSMGRKEIRESSYINQVQDLTEDFSQQSINREEKLDFFNNNETRVYNALQMANEMGYDISESDLFNSENPEEFILQIEREYEDQKQNISDTANDSSNSDIISDEADNLEQEQWSQYSDDKFKYVFSFPTNIGVVRRVTENSPLQIQVQEYDASFEVQALLFNTVSDNMSRSEYVEYISSVGGSKLEGSIEISGAEEAYLISSEDMDFKNQTVIAFKGENIYRLSYFIFGEDKENQDILATNKQYFDKMIQSFIIE